MFAKFTYLDTVLNYNGLNYNPCNDVIFPSIVEAYKYFPHPLGRYYMYYSPHNAPGGICLAFADKLVGPWQEYPSNPIISNAWSPYYSVTHVSSPHAIWIEGSLFLYFHGENTCTRFANSSDGIHFNYGGIAVTDRDFNCRYGAFYARVFSHAIASLKTSYVMLLMCHLRNTSGIFLAYSQDGRYWQTRRNPILIPPAGSGLKHLCSAFLFSQGGSSCIILFHGDTPDMSTDIYAVEVDAEFKSTRFIGKILDKEAVSPDNRRVSDPYLVGEGDQVYLFCSTGARLNQVIGIAAAKGNESTIYDLLKHINTEGKWLIRFPISKLVNRHQGVLERLLPTGMRYYYELVLSGIMVILNEGWRSFWYKFRQWLKCRHWK
jgi:hypothetical protein